MPAVVHRGVVLHNNHRQTGSFHPLLPPPSDLTEILRALDYPHVVSIDDFRNPNFELVADMLYWMANKYDPDISIRYEK